MFSDLLNVSDTPAGGGGGGGLYQSANNHQQPVSVVHFPEKIVLKLLRQISGKTGKENFRKICSCEAQQILRKINYNFVLKKWLTTNKDI